MMDVSEMEGLIRKIDQRTERIEQILPGHPTREEMQAAVVPLATKEEVRAAVAPLATKEEMQAAVAPLATKEEMRAAVAPLATKEEVRAAVAPLATKEEMREEGERTRRHFDIVAERMRDDISLIAEGHADLDRRVTRLERTRRGPSSPR